MLSPKAKEQTDMVQFIRNDIEEFVLSSPLNRLPGSDYAIFDKPLVGYADGDDPLFTEYKTIIAPTHLTPREILTKTFNKNPQDLPEHLSVISWSLPISSKVRKSNYRHTRTPSRYWTYTRWYGEKLNDALREHVVKLLTEMGYLATAPSLQPYFEIVRATETKGDYSNWSERHAAYAAGLGTFSLTDAFITERGIAHRCGSVVTSLALPASPRIAKNHYANCLFYVNGKCMVCTTRCPSKAITKDGHDKRKCRAYVRINLQHLKKKYDVEMVGCGLCQTKVPCEFRNPTRKLKKTD